MSIKTYCHSLHPFVSNNLRNTRGPARTHCTRHFDAAETSHAYTSEDRDREYFFTGIKSSPVPEIRSRRFPNYPPMLLHFLPSPGPTTVGLHSFLGASMSRWESSRDLGRGAEVSFASSTSIAQHAQESSSPRSSGPLGRIRHVAVSLPDCIPKS